MSPSLRARALNLWLKLTEKPHLARSSDVDKLRRSFELKARWLFHGPRGVTFAAGTLGGVKALYTDGRGPVLLYLHGGAYVFGSAKTHSAMVATLCAKTGCAAYLLDYRLAPEYPFPAAFEDALAAYEGLLAEGVQEIIIGGDSAGGGLALALLSEICRKGLPQPKGVFALSPLTDMRFSGASVQGNARVEVILPVHRVNQMRDMYLGEASTDDPRVSPLYASFGNACPVWLAVGDTEILRDDSTRMAARLEAEGVEVHLHVERNLPHVWPIFHNLIPEARRSLEQIACWIRSL